MIIEFVEIIKNNRATTSLDGTSAASYALREVYINPDFVVCVRRDNFMKKNLSEGLLPESLDSQHEFSKIYLDGSRTGIDIVVVGDPEAVEKRLAAAKQSRKELLLG